MDECFCEECSLEGKIAQVGVFVRGKDCSSVDRLGFGEKFHTTNMTKLASKRR